MARRKTLLSDSVNDHLQCRDFGHAWKWTTDFKKIKGVDDRPVVMTRMVECLRCGTIRYDEYAVPSMNRIKSSYTYPDGYKVVGYTGHISVAEVRQEILARFRKKEW
jgi:hypothetical protein